MKFLSLIVFATSMSVCYAGSNDSGVRPHHKKDHRHGTHEYRGGCWHRAGEYEQGDSLEGEEEEGQPRPGDRHFGRRGHHDFHRRGPHNKRDRIPAFDFFNPKKCSAAGLASFSAKSESLTLHVGDVITPPLSMGYNVNVNKGEFSIETEGTYTVGYVARIHLEKAVAGNSVTIGVLVNDEVVKTDVLTCETDEENCITTYRFFANKRFELSLKAGDKVKFKIVEASLSDDATISMKIKRPFPVFFLNMPKETVEETVS